MDLATGRVGFPTEHGFFNYTMEHLATWAGLGERRAARIVATLKDAGYLAVSQIRERLKDGSSICNYMLRLCYARGKWVFQAFTPFGSQIQNDYALCLRMIMAPTIMHGRPSQPQLTTGSRLQLFHRKAIYSYLPDVRANRLC